MSFTDVVRNITSKLEVKWDGTNWTDETSRLSSASGNSVGIHLWRLLGNTAATQPAASAIFTMIDGDRYSPFNTSSSIYSYISSNRGYSIPVRYSMSADGGTTYVRVFTGKIDNLSMLSTKNNTTKIQCVSDAQTLIRKKVSTSMMVGQQQSTVISYLASLGNVTNLDISPSLGTVPYSWLSDEGIMSEMIKIAQSDGGRVFVDRNGVLTFRNAEDWVTLPETTTVQNAFTVSRISDISVTFDRNNVYDKVIVVYAPRSMSKQAVLWSLSSTIEIEANSTVTVECKYNKPAKNVTVSDVKTITYDGEDATPSTTVSLTTKYAQRATLEIGNTSSDYIVVTKANIIGNTILGRKAGQVEYTVSLPSIEGKTLYITDNEFVQTHEQASLIGEFVRDTVGVVRNVYRFSAPFIPSLEPFHLISLSESESGISANGYITSIGWRYNKGGATASYEMIDATDWIPNPSGYFTIGTDTLDGGKVAFY